MASGDTTRSSSPDLSGILAELRALVARSDNEFIYSWWVDTAEALLEIDALSQAHAATGLVPVGLSALFLPTSGLQELALSSGWGDEFCALADRFHELTAD